MRSGLHFENASCLAELLRSCQIEAMIWHGQDQTIEMRIVDNSSCTLWLTINPALVARVVFVDYTGAITRTEACIQPEHPDYHETILGTIKCLLQKPPAKHTAQDVVTSLPKE